MYMNLLGKPTDLDLNTFTHVLLTGPHDWDPSVLDYTHLPQLVTPPGPQIPHNAVHMTPRLMNLANVKGRVPHTLSHSPGQSNIAQHKHAINPQPIDFEKLRHYFA